MPCKISIISDGTIIENKLDGECSPEEIFQSVKDVAVYHEEKGITKFVVDCSTFESNDRYPTLNAYKIMQLYEELDAGRSANVALVVPFEGSIKEHLKFFEMATKNRGFQVQIFPDRKNALAWLKRP
jgi:hypothetical protein